MAGSVNKVIVVGNLGADPEVRYTPGGQAVANFNVATSESWTNKQGTREERTEWHRIVAWGRLAELCGEYLSKGRKVYIEGRLQTRSYEKEGVTRYVTEIKAQDIQFLDGGGGASASSGGGERGGAPAENSRGGRSYPRAVASSGGRGGGGRGGGGGRQAEEPSNDFGAPDYAEGDDDDIPF